MADEEQASEEAAHAPGKSSMMLAVAGLVGGLVIGGLGGSFALGPVLAKKFAAPKSAEAATAEEKGGDEEHESGKGGEKKTGATVHMMENLVLNPSGSNGTR